VPENIDWGIIVADVVRVKLDEKYVNKKYLVYAINSDSVIKQFQIKTKGTTRPRVNLAHIRKLELPIAPLPEQRRIVARIEELFSRLDAGIEALQRARALLRRYRQAVLKAAVEGRLTEQWRKEHPEVEPAEKLLETILRERRIIWEAKHKSQGKDHSFVYKEPTSPDLFSLPELPVQWCWATTEQLASTEKHSLAIGPFGSDLKVEDYRDEGVPLIFVRNIRSATFDGPDTRYVSYQKAEELGAHKVESGDILITKMGEPPGDACLYPENMPTAIITADCIKWNLSQLLQEKKFFVHALNSNLVRRQFLGITKGVAQQKVSLQRFKGIAIPLAPQAEEYNIVTELEYNLSIIDKTENTISTNLIRADRLRQSILKRAFEGKLVPQDISDEPASVLLFRIFEAKEQRKKKINQSKPANRKETTMPRRKLSLNEVLAEAKTQLMPQELFYRAGFSKENVDEFYQELRDEIDRIRIIEIRPNETDVYLKVVENENK
jgi:type I restriction enzyme, S subunit